MNGTPLADAADEVIAGERDTEMLIGVLRVSLTCGDELYHLLRRHAHDDAWLRGAARVLQRIVERPAR